MGKIVTLPGRHTLDEIFDEIVAVRTLLERLIDRPSPPQEWLTIQQAAALLHRTPQAIRFRCRRGLGVKVQGKWRISRDQLFS
jgi:hypothetical protein